MIRILKPHYKKMKIYELKGAVCRDILVICLILLPLVIFFRYDKLQQDRTERWQNTTYAHEKVIKKLSTPRTYSDIELDKVESYIRKVFGKDGKVAVAVAKGECRGLNQNCRLVTVKEHSVCQFQINIKAHYDKIPGKDLDEQEKWLMNAQNCTLMAYQIFKTSGWYPWTSYTSGTYLKYL